MIIFFALTFVVEVSVAQIAHGLVVLPFSVPTVICAFHAVFPVL